MKCPSCMKEIDDGRSFCPNCGMTLGASGAMSKKTPGEGKRSSIIEKKAAKADRAAAARKWTNFIAIIVVAVGFYLSVKGYDAYRIQRAFKNCELHRRTGEYERGAQKCRFVVDRNPKHAEAWAELVKCNMGMDVVRGDDALKEAIKTINEAFHWTKTSELHALLGQAQYMLGNDAEAITALEEALSLDENNRIANQYLGYALSEEDAPRAIERLTLALKGAGRIDRMEINEELGDLYFAAGKYDKSILAYLEVARVDLNRVDTCMKLARAYVQSGQLDKASLEAARCQRISPDSEEAIALKVQVNNYIEQIDTLKYIVTRKKVDDILMMLYNSFLAHIEMINRDSSAFCGEENLALDQMITDIEGLYKSYHNLKPTQAYFTVHSLSLSTIVSLQDTMKYLRKYLKECDREQNYELSKRLNKLNKTYTHVITVWDREYSEMNLEVLLKNSDLLETASGSLKIPFPPSPSLEKSVHKAIDE